MEKSKLIKYNVIAIVLATLFFLIGIFFGTLMQTESVSSSERVLSNVETKFNDIETSMILLNMKSDIACEYYNIKLKEIDNQLTSLTPTIVKMEKDVSLKEQSYKELKTRFINLRLKYWILNEKDREMCNPNKTTILYFYTTNGVCRDCEQQGVILSYVMNKVDKKDIIVAPVDMTEHILLLDIIKKTYNITKAPALLIDNSVVYKGLVEKDKIYNYLCNVKNLTLDVCKTS